MAGAFSSAFSSAFDIGGGGSKLLLRLATEVALMRWITKGSTDQSVVIRIVDSTDGTPETGVVFNTAGIDLWYRREGAVKTSITEATLSALNDAHSDGGILHIGDGYYRLDLPDAAVATASNGVAVGGTVTGMVVIGCYVPLVDANPYDAVRMGLTALPNAAADAAGGLPISDAGGLDLDARLDAAVSSRMATYTQPTGFLSATFPAGTVANTTNITAGTITTVTTTTTATNVTTVNGLAAGVITAASIATGAIDTTTFASGCTIPRCTLTDTVTTYTGNTPQTGDAYAIVNSGTHGNAAIKGFVDDIGTAGAGLTAVPWNAAWDAEVQSEVQDAIEVNNLILLTTTIATLASQTSFTLTAGSADSSAYTGCLLVVQDAVTAVQKCVAQISTYTGSTKTIGLLSSPGVFTVATGDTVVILPNRLDLAYITLDAVATNVQTAVNGIDTLAGLIDAVPTADEVWSAPTRILTGATNITSTGGTTVPQTGDSFARIGATGSSLTSLASAADLATVDDFLDTEVAAIKAKTDLIPASPAAVGSAMTLATGAVSAAALASDAVDEIWAKAMTELAAVPAVTDTVLDAIRWMFLVARNKITQTATTQLVRNNADSATVGTATVSDDGTTFTRGKFS